MNNKDKIEKALNKKGYKISSYNYEKCFNGLTNSSYEIEYERIDKSIILPIKCKSIFELSLKDVIQEINKLLDLNDIETLKILIDSKPKIW